MGDLEPQSTDLEQTLAFEAALTDLVTMAESPLMEDFALRVFFKTIPIVTDEDLSRAFDAVQGHRPTVAEDIQREFEALYQFQAQCIPEDADIFFSGKKKDIKAAKAICKECVVKSECLDYALKHGEKFGVWGGKSEDERQSILDKQAVTV